MTSVAVSGFAIGWPDGFSNAPVTDPAQPTYSTVTTQAASLAFNTLLNSYGGQNARITGLIGGKQYQPPWHVAGIDYPVGINASALPLQSVATLSIAGCTVNNSTHVVTVNSSGTVVINGFDFSVSGGYQLNVISSPTLNLTVENCYFQVGANLLIPVIGDGNQVGTFTFKYNVVDINALNHNYNQTTGAIAVNAFTYVMQYNWIANGCSELLVVGNSTSQNVTLIDIRFNCFGTSGYNVATTGLHGDGMQMFGQSGFIISSVIVDFNTFYFDDSSNNWEFQAFSIFSANQTEPHITNVDCSYNTGVNPLSIAGNTNQQIFGWILYSTSWFVNPPTTNYNFFDPTIFLPSLHAWVAANINGGSNQGPFPVALGSIVGNVNMTNAAIQTSGTVT